MKTKSSIILFLLMLAISLPAADSTNRLFFPASRFSIAPLEAAPGTATGQALMMLLPITRNFAGNVNVLIQPYNGTMSEYTAVTLKQFKEARLKDIEHKKIADSIMVFEYSGPFQGRALHWYARAEKTGEQVYLVTATAAEEEWPKQKVQLKACVDSFRCESDSAKNAAPPNR
jgi:hypothetical protein